MKADTTKLTIRLPREDVEFAKAYATAHGVTVTEVIDRYLRRMRALEGRKPSEQVEFITGMLPSDIDAEEEYRRHVQDKHRR